MTPSPDIDPFSPPDDRARRLVVIVLVLLTGVFTGAQLAKTAPLIGWYVEEMGLSLVAAGWLTALIGIFVALAALPAGFAIARVGPGRAFAAAAVVLVAGGLLLATTGSVATAFGARLVEGAGYVVLCVALPSLLAAVSPPAWRATVLAVWSGFVPLGYASSDAISAILVPLAGPPVFLLAMTGLFALFAATSLTALRALPPVPRPQDRPRPGGAITMPVVLIAAAFGAFVLQTVALFTYLPTFAALPGALLVAPALVPLSTPVGNLLAGVLVRGRGGGWMMRLAAAAFLVTALGALLAKLGPGPAAATLGVFVVAVASGVVASALFAAIPAYVGQEDVPRAIGLVSQAGGIATLASPPLAAFVIEGAGWPAYGVMLAACGLAGIVVLLPLIAAERPRGP